MIFAASFAACSILFAQNPAAKGPAGRKPVDMQGAEAYSIKYMDTTALCLVGDVMFYHNGTVITCDSAVRYSEKRMECFRNVLINKDSLYVYGDRAEYDGEANMAYVYSPLIKVVDGDAVMYTYNFSYNTLDNIGRFSGGAIVTKGDNRLEAKRGYYFADSSEVVCVEAVQMRDSIYRLQSDSVIYNLDDDVARFFSSTFVWNDKNEMVNADAGRYDRPADRFELYKNSYVLSEKQEVWADSIDYNRTTGDAVLRRNIQIDDIDYKVLAFGDYGEYWGEREEALLTVRPSVISYDPEQGDSLYVRADSILLFTPRAEAADSVGMAVDSVAIVADTLQSHRPEESVSPADNMPASEDGVPDNPMTDAPVTEQQAADMPVGSGSEAEIPESTEPQPEESTEQPPMLPVPPKEVQSAPAAEDGGVTAEKERAKADKTAEQAEKQARREARLKKKAEERRRKRAERMAKYEKSKGIYRDSVATSRDSTGIQPVDSLPAEGMIAPADSVVMTERGDSIADSTVRRIIRAYRNVRSYRNDFQTVCDSMAVLSEDSTIHLYIRPVLWNENNQITAQTIDIYTANQQITRAEFVGDPIMAEMIDTSAYNQVAGKTLEALFRDNEIYRVNAVGNGQTLYYTVDENSGAVTEFMKIECADITFLIAERKVETIVWRGNPVYSIYAIEQVPPDMERRLKNFEWQGDRRPALEDVFDRQIIPSIRERMLAMPQPQFPIMRSINRHRQRLVDSGQWMDRNDTLSPEAVEFIESVEK